VRKYGIGITGHNAAGISLSTPQENEQCCQIRCLAPAENEVARLRIEELLHLLNGNPTFRVGPPFMPYSRYTAGGN